MMNKKRVVLYVRVSTQEQALEGYSIDEQIERLTKYCEAMNWIVVKIYVDPGYSGGDMNRPGLKDMLRDLKQGRADSVVVYKLDRLSRSQKDTLILLEDEFLANNVDFVSMTENFSTDNAFGRAMVGILAVFAQLERDSIRERMTMGREARAKKGYYSPSGKVLTGYDYIDGELVPNEYESMIVNEIFELFNAGTPIKTIADTLTEKGYLCNFADHWDDMVVRRLLSNRHYIGEVSYAKKWYPGKHTGIVDPEVFDFAQSLLKRRAEDYKNREVSNAHTTALGGFLYCGRCGARYHRQLWRPKQDNTRTAKYCCYSRSKKTKRMIIDPNCKNRNIPVAELDTAIFDEIRKLAIDPEYVETIRSEDNRDDETKRKIETIQKEIDELSKQISAFMDLYSLRKLSLQEVDAKIEPLADKREKLEETLAELCEAEPEETTGPTNAEIVEKAKSFDAILERGNINEIRTTISTFIRKITIDGEKITIDWNFS